MRIADVVARQDWVRIGTALDQEGHALISGVLDDEQIHALCHAPPTMPSSLIDDLQQAFHRHLAPIAKCWDQASDRAHRPPGTSAAHWQLSRLRAGNDQPLHDNSRDAQGFPLQLVALLGEPGRDFTGGAFVMTEQRPRMQSRPIVVPLRRGDMAVIAAAQRPHRGTQGIYAVHLRHGVGRVRSGERIGLEVLLGAPCHGTFTENR